MGICNNQILDILVNQAAKEALEYQIENDIPESKKYEERRWKIDYIIAINSLNRNDKYYEYFDYTNIS